MNPDRHSSDRLTLDQIQLNYFLEVSDAKLDNDPVLIEKRNAAIVELRNRINPPSECKICGNEYHSIFSCPVVSEFRAIRFNIMPDIPMEIHMKAQRIFFKKLEDDNLLPLRVPLTKENVMNPSLLRPSSGLP